jgi:NADH dehydrogenase
MTSHPRIAELDAQKDNIGRVVVNANLEVPGFPGVYALGDCAHFEDPKSAQPIPPRAHTTVRQAKVAAYNILAEIRGRNKQAYHYTDTGEIVSVGDSKAVFRFYRLRLYGFPARLIWLGAYSLLVTGKYNRARIVTDWLLSQMFGRDATFLNFKEL